MTIFPSSPSSSFPRHFQRFTPSPLHSSPHNLHAHLSHALLGAFPHGVSLERVVIHKHRASPPPHSTSSSTVTPPPSERYSISYTVTVPSPSVLPPPSSFSSLPLSYAAAAAGRATAPRFTIRLVTGIEPVSGAAFPRSSGKATADAARAAETAAEVMDGDGEKMTDSPPAPRSPASPPRMPPRISHRSCHRNYP
jgi:hypothetical protein